MTIDEAIEWQKQQALKNYDEATWHCEKVAKLMIKKAKDYEQLAEWLECLKEIATLYIEHRAFGEYPTTKEEYADETMKILDKYKIEIQEKE